MANKTVILNNQVFAGTSGLTLLLINPTTGAIGNGSGDVLTPGANGNFSAVVTENITGWWHVVVNQGSVPVIADELVYFPSDVEGTYLVNPNIYTLTSPTPVTPSPAPLVTGYWTVYDETGALDVGAIIVMKCARAPEGSGFVLEDIEYEATANGSGVAAFPGLFPGAWYTVYRKTSTRKAQVQVPVGASGSVPLGNIVS